jgi:hypothetical protein
LVFHNPFMGKAVLMCEPFQPPRAMGVYHANLDLNQASTGTLSVRSREGTLDLYYQSSLDFPKGLNGKEVSADYRMCEENVGYDLSLADAVDRLKGTGVVGCPLLGRCVAEGGCWNTGKSGWCKWTCVHDTFDLHPNDSCYDHQLVWNTCVVVMLFV